MPADASIYDSARLALCYANDRPPIHGAICTRLFAAIPRGRKFGTALDIGCGAGVSINSGIGASSRRTCDESIDPFERIAAWRARQKDIRKRHSCKARAEALPLNSGSIALVTAAGSLSYTNLGAALSEVSRVLLPKRLLRTIRFQHWPRCAAKLAGISVLTGLRKPGCSLAGWVCSRFGDVALSGSDGLARSINKCFRSKSK